VVDAIGYVLLESIASCMFLGYELFCLTALENRSTTPVSGRRREKTDFCIVLTPFVSFDENCFENAGRDDHFSLCYTWVQLATRYRTRTTILPYF